METFTEPVPASIFIRICKFIRLGAVSRLTVEGTNQINEQTGIKKMMTQLVMHLLTPRDLMNKGIMGEVNATHCQSCPLIQICQPIWAGGDNDRKVKSVAVVDPYSIHIAVHTHLPYIK